MAPLLEMENIRKEFKGVVALDKVNLTLHAGEVHALLGENGAGKSTLMKVLNGVYRAESGSIRLNGKEVFIQGVKDAQRLGISIVYQELNLCGHLSVADNIFLGRPKSRWGVIDDKYKLQAAQKLMDEFHLSINPRQKVNKLSVAQRQMVEIIKAISKDPSIIVFDEPTSSLTEAEITELFRVIRMLRQKGKGILYISHRMEELDEIADRVTVLRDGKYINTFIYKETSIDELIRNMVGRPLQDKYPKHERKIGDVVFEAKNIRQKNKINVDGFSLRSGEILGVAGLVGAGRTETMRMIFGVDKADSCEVYMNGKRVDINSPKDAINLGIAYLTEDRKEQGLALTKDVDFNINMASFRQLAHSGVIDDREGNRRSRKFVESLSIKTPSLGQKVIYLSGGNQQKVVLAKWLNRGAKVMIFDEPTRGIDVGAKYEIYRMMNELSDQGIGIIMISSDLPEILGMSDRIMVFCEGSITGIIDRENADQEKILRYATKTHNAC